MSRDEAPEPPDDAAARQRAHDLERISRSGLFDLEYYLAQYPDIAAAGVAPLEHFFDFGFREGRRPNLYFDPLWYLDQNTDVRASGVHPLTHYLGFGDLEGRKPSLLFDPSWYRRANALTGGECALAHYLSNRRSNRFAPIPDFDIEHYISSYPDIAAAGIDAFEHFVLYGYREGRVPSRNFDSKFYWTRYLQNDTSQNPFLHYLQHKHEPGVYGRMPESEASIPREVKRFTKPAPEFEEFAPLPASAPRRAKLLTYYLPQFHAFPENDGWWGKGFTEWANVPRGLPRFKGHYQPRVPRDLGFYSLDHLDTLRRQVELAQAGGVHGFVYYYYWFNGKRLLDRPLEAFLGDASIQMPFCLMWANENWTRRWDGADAEILISQDYRADDEAGLLADFVRYFRDPRYIRVQGRPLLMIYRPGLITGGHAAIERWRELFRTRFNEDPLLVMGQTFNATDPTALGLDGAIEFPPHKLTQNMQPINNSLQYLDMEFEGKAYRYDDVVSISLNEPKPAFPLIKTAVPSWDNDARRQGSGLVLTESTPQKYQAWLSELVDRALRNPFFGEPLVCVNAWNEWCEAAYLEPDLHYGSAYLNATARAIAGKAVHNADGRLLLVGHDCFPSGAQHLLLNIGRTLRGCFGVEIAVVLLDGGKLEAAYRELGPVTILPPGSKLESHLWSLREQGFRAAIVNTSASASAVPALRKVGYDTTLLVHELPRILREKKLVAGARAGAEQASRIVFPAPYVRDQFLAVVGLERTQGLVTLPQGLYQKTEQLPGWREERRREFGVTKKQKLVVGVGYADLRKGFDLFMQVWRMVRASGKTVAHFCWVGDIDPELRDFLRHEIEQAENIGTFHMAGYRSDVPSFLAAADAFVLTSREDPFPSVVLEALHAGLPVVVFDQSGGIPDLLREHSLGHVVPFGDTVAMAETIGTILKNGTPAAGGEAGRKLIEQGFDFSEYTWRLLKLTQPALPAISAAVPNYNYARHMPARLSSIFLQSQPVREILVLDDCSTDDSLQVIPAVAAEWGRRIEIIPNQVNSGSVFKQWRKAAERARGDYLWIAEADDRSEPRFLAGLVALMQYDPTVQFTFCDSATIDADGKPLGASYKDYYATVRPNALSRTEVFEAGDFVRKFLAVKNLILNVSAVLWRREALLAAMDRCATDLQSFRMAGDWRLYLEALNVPGAHVGYCAEPLNVHRRHAASVTHSLNADRHVAEIAACQAFATSAFAPGAEERKAQESYIAEVTAQLGAAEQPTGKGRTHSRASVARRA